MSQITDYFSATKGGSSRSRSAAKKALQATATAAAVSTLGAVSPPKRRLRSRTGSSVVTETASPLTAEIKPTLTVTLTARPQAVKSAAKSRAKGKSKASSCVNQLAARIDFAEDVVDGCQQQQEQQQQKEEGEVIAQQQKLAEEAARLKKLEERREKQRIRRQKIKEEQLQKQKELELQKQKELELQKQELELQKQKELELQKQTEVQKQETERRKQEAKQEREQKLLQSQRRKLERQQMKENAAVTLSSDSSNRAHNRYRHLIQAEPPAAAAAAEVTVPAAAPSTVDEAARLEKLQLQLPPDHSLLRQLFNSAELIVKLMFTKQLITFSKLKQRIELMTRRSFEQHHLGQIWRLYPNSYTLKWQRVQQQQQKQQKQQKHELVIAPDLCNDGTPSAATAAATAAATSSIPADGDANQLSEISQRHLLERRSEFLLRLYRDVAEKHRQFLLSLGVSAAKVPDLSSIRRWHPSFQLDSPSLTVTPADLPESPDAAEAKVVSASEALAMVRQNLPARVNRVLNDIERQQVVDLQQQQQQQQQKQQQQQSSCSQQKASTPSTSGINPSLLARIRRKDAEAKLQQLLRDPVSESELAVLDKLPPIASCLRVQFLAERRPALPAEDVLDKLCRSYRGEVSVSEMQQLVDKLVELCPNWVKQFSLPAKPGKLFIRVDKTVALSTVLAVIKERRDIVVAK